MKPKQTSAAFTVLELFIIVAVIFIFLGLAASGGNRGKQKATRINCVCNLKQIGLAFRIWSGDHNDKYPMQFFTNETGGLVFADEANGFRYFQVMSNELSTPKLLVCPTDKQRTRANNFTTDFNQNRVGYFVGLEAAEICPQSLLAGDWNITNGTAPVNGILNLQSNQPIGGTEALHERNGNVGLGDGSVQQLSSAKLKESVAYTGLATNRLLLP